MAWRHFTLVGFFLLAGLGLIFRVVSLNVTEGQFLIDQGERRSIKSQQIAAHRGVIYDRFGEPLAVSTPAAAVYANPREGSFGDAELTSLCEVLAMDCPQLKARLARFSTRNFVYIKRGVAWDDARRVEALNLPGIELLKEYRRFYPGGETTAHVVGITDIDDVGIEGIELSFND
ncbi:MAG TPA: penicillin-binding protein 2, partial [Pseudomonadales bacterium]